MEVLTTKISGYFRPRFQVEKWTSRRKSSGWIGTMTLSSSSSSFTSVRTCEWPLPPTYLEGNLPGPLTLSRVAYNHRLTLYNNYTHRLTLSAVIMYASSLLLL